MRSQPIRKYTVAIAMLHTVAGRPTRRNAPNVIGVPRASFF